jgi:hypothetical protein
MERERQRDREIAIKKYPERKTDRESLVVGRGRHRGEI